MTAMDIPWGVTARPQPALPRVARAYCGPAHGRTWPVVTDGPPPALVDVRLGVELSAQTVQYRLVHHPRTRRPVRDHAGSYLYMPIRTVPVGPVSRAPVDVDLRLPVQERVRELVAGEIGRAHV